MSKLLVYGQNIGLLSAITRPLSQLKSRFSKPPASTPDISEVSKTEVDNRYLQNFKKLWEDLVMEPKKNILLLDAGEFPVEFIKHLESHNISYLDYGTVFDRAEEPVTLIFDQHWNDYGRTLLADQIARGISDENLNKQESSSH